MSDKVKYDVLVIGGGIFGCLTAIELSKAGFDVNLLERNSLLMQGASLNNQNRLHLGYHYPRDLETAKQCQRGFYSFKERYKQCILDGFDNAYFISDKGSKVDFKEYLNFCQDASLEIKKIDYCNFDIDIKNISGGILTNEVVYDSYILKRLVESEIKNQNVRVECDTSVSCVEETNIGFSTKTNKKNIESKAIVNCTYANLNSFNLDLGVTRRKLQFELTVVPIIRWRSNLKPLGITVMDGKFFTVLPFGKSEFYLLYHVEHTVQDTFIGYKYPESWTNPKSAISNTSAKQAFEKMVSSSSYWLPEIINAEYVDYLATIRVVLADVDITDKRPSLINKISTKNPFYTVFSGKIDHSIWVANDLTSRLLKELQPLFNQNYI